MIKSSTFGTLPCGEEVKKIEISQEDGNSVSILTFGAIIQAFNVNGRNIVFSSPHLEDYLGDGSYKGQCVAPYANRIAGATFTLDGKTSVLEKNNGNNNLHSGSANLGQKNWNILFQTDTTVILNTAHRDGEGGFPGNIGITLAYTFENNTLSMSYTMSSDRKVAINPTNHSYFNLKGDGSSILDHKVTIFADSYVAVDDELIPTTVESVENTPFDFRTPHTIGERREGKYDHCFVFGSEKTAIVEAAGLRLRVRTDRPGMQLYTGASNPVCRTDWPQSGPFCALALETSELPDAVNRPSFKPCILEAGGVFKTKTSYSVEEVKDGR